MAFNSLAHRGGPHVGRRVVVIHVRHFYKVGEGVRAMGKCLYSSRPIETWASWKGYQKLIVRESPAHNFMDDATIVVFARHPTPGRVKTRLAAGVGPNAAAQFYKHCAETVIAECLK